MGDMLKDSLLSGLAMIFGGNPELYLIVFVSLRCTAIACLMASSIGIPLAFCLANYDFRGRRTCVLLLNTLQALPTVVVGLFLYVFISRRGILGPLDMLYTWKAITLGQFILILPLVTMFVLAALSRLDERYRLTAITLGANERQAALTVLREARFAVVAALCAAFGRGIAEVGVSMMLGGNIKGFTRTMTTAMALEYDKGEFTLALALGIVLLSVSFLLNFTLAFFQGRTGR
jgi:tungstate transport system permease protein